MNDLETRIILFCGQTKDGIYVWLIARPNLAHVIAFSSIKKSVSNWHSHLSYSFAKVFDQLAVSPRLDTQEGGELSFKIVLKYLSNK